MGRVPSPRNLGSEECSESAQSILQEAHGESKPLQPSIPPRKAGLGGIPSFTCLCSPSRRANPEGARAPQPLHQVMGFPCFTFQFNRLCWSLSSLPALIVSNSSNAKPFQSSANLIRKHPFELICSRSSQKTPGVNRCSPLPR